MGGAKLVERHGEVSDDGEGSAAHLAEPGSRNAVPYAVVHQLLYLVRGDCDDGPSSGFGEEGDERLEVGLEGDPAADTTAQAGLDQCLRQPTVGEIMRGREQAASRGLDQQPCQCALGRKVNAGRLPAEMSMDGVSPLRAAELVEGLPEEVDRVTGLTEADGRPPGHVVEHAEHADHWCRQDGRLSSLVVERDVPAGHRKAEVEAAGGEPTYCLGELPHDLGILG